jgi:hypothetical protein
MLVPILLVTFLSVSVPSPSPIVDLEKEREALLAIHASDRAAHFQTDAARLLEHSGETFVAVSDGRITRPTLGEQRQFFEEYFRGAKYSEWDDLEPPIVQVSKDGTMAWMIVRTSVRRKAPDASGVEREARFVYAGIMTYEKRAGRWVRTANVSTFEHVARACSGSAPDGRTGERLAGCGLDRSPDSLAARRVGHGETKLF